MADSNKNQFINNNSLCSKKIMDDLISEKFIYSKENRLPFSLIIFTIDNLNKIPKKEIQEKISKEICIEIKSVINKKENYIGYYDDNRFVIILIAAQTNEALHLCHTMADKISFSDNFNINGEKIVLSIGISSYPENADSAEDLKKEAENTLLSAQKKENNKILISKKICHFFNTRKRKIATVAERNRVINNIISVIYEKDNFLVIGHKEPDEDCIASMVAFGLLIRKFYKRVTILLYKEYQHKFPYLMQICKYNYISVIDSEKMIENIFSVIVALDTPKPSMLEGGEKIAAMIAHKKIIKIELDHHLEADSGYIGDNNYCFADESSSTCELIGYLTFKLNKKEFLEQYKISDLFSRNFVVAIITGMISDSKMGKYLKSARQKLFYKYFSTRCNKLLLGMTNINSDNFSSINDIFSELEKLSDEETSCYEYFIERKKRSKHITYTIIDKHDIDYFYKTFKKELIASVARRMADDLAEESGFLSIVIYYDNPEESDLIQYRMRRSHTFSKIDLRDVIKELKIENGGGHPGAVGFRFKKDTVSDLNKFTEEIIEKIEVITEKALKAE